MADIVFVTWDGGGNLVPACGIAGALRARGDSVRFLGHPRQRAVVEGAGFPFRSYQHARHWSSAEDLPRLAAIRAYLGMLTDNGMGRDLATALEQAPADLVVVDCMLFGALRAVRQTGVRYAVLFHTFYDYFTRHFAKGPVLLAAWLHGQRPRRLWADAELGLVTTLRDLDPAGRRGLPPKIRFVGPVLPKAAPARAGSEPRILISLSTARFEGQTEVLQMILDAVAPLPVRAIVTASDGVDAERLIVPANVERHRYLPHADVMPGASLVVNHGGHSTTMLALAHNLPVLVVPVHPMTDQRWIGRAVEQAGAGAVVDRKASPEVIRASIRELLRDGPHRVASAHLGARLRECRAAAWAADELHRLTQDCPPLSRQVDGTSPEPAVAVDGPSGGQPVCWGEKRGEGGTEKRPSL